MGKLGIDVRFDEVVVGAFLNPRLFQKHFRARRWINMDHLDMIWQRGPVFHGRSPVLSDETKLESSVWVSVSDERCYLCTGDDAMHHLRFTVRSSRYTISHYFRVYIEQPIVNNFTRKVMPIHDLLGIEGSSHPENTCVSIMSYNVLADSYCTKKNHSQALGYELDWSYRKNNIIERINHYQPNFLALQVHLAIFILLIARNWNNLQLNKKIYLNTLSFIARDLPN
eukprot:TRINITY_DN1429_c0_g1_i8.p1 TRINITY_DN1429_c0_g1~~TRINITY_DN1429_c0_g1_i8.p1  ORF type:complete len:226 (+),score=22.84 TRINITY_DN1429_c0_g1_i8:13-690(+)